MCLLIVLSRVVPGLPLVVVANRDERLDRPATPMAVLREHDPRTLGGRDLVGGGTWLAANERGVVAGLTNRPLVDGADPAKRSRGELPLALTAHDSARAAVAAFVGDHRPADYNPAWLLVGDRDALFSIDMTGSPLATVDELGPGVHVLENRPLGEASVKVDRTRELVGDVQGLSADEVIRRLESVAADHEVPVPPPGVAPERVALAAPCGHIPGYGTRWSGIVTVPADRLAPPSFRYSDGPPCEQPYLVADSRW